MGITLHSSNIDQVLKEMTEKKFLEYQKTMIEAGRIVIATAKQNGSYKDDTGDLRNANGFLVSVDGVIKHAEFASGTAGRKAREKANEVLRPNTDGLFLIVVNGMEYAYYVESKGYDVLTSAEQLAKRIIPMMLKR